MKRGFVCAFHAFHALMLLCAFRGQLGHEWVYHALTQIYCWPKMYKDAKGWLRGRLTCATCRDHPDTSPHYNILKQRAFSTCWWKFVLEMHIRWKGNKHIIVFVDFFSKYCEVFATTNQTVKTIAQLFVDNIVCQRGCPTKLLSNRGSVFMSDLLREVLSY